MQPKLILCDLDGTLLHSDKTISKKTELILKACRNNGILIGFSTSRGRANIIPYEKQIKPDILICNGGASVFYMNKLLLAQTFTLEQTRIMLDTAYTVCGPDCEITLDTLDKLFWNRHKNKSTDYSFDAIYDDFKNFAEPAMKICVQTDDKTKAQKIASSVQDCDYLPFSDIPWYKFSSSNSTKEYGINFLCKEIGITVSDILAFGDDHNDIGMLKLCGTGVAMENAIPKVKQAADDVTKSNDNDGIAWYISKLLQIQ